MSRRLLAFLLVTSACGHPTKSPAAHVDSRPKTTGMRCSPGNLLNFPELTLDELLQPWAPKSSGSSLEESFLQANIPREVTDEAATRSITSYLGNIGELALSRLVREGSMAYRVTDFEQRQLFSVAILGGPQQCTARRVDVKAERYRSGFCLATRWSIPMAPAACAAAFQCPAFKSFWTTPSRNPKPDGLTEGGGWIVEGYASHHSHAVLRLGSTDDSLKDCVAKILLLSHEQIQAREFDLHGTAH